MKAQYGILRFKKYKGPAISPIEAHNERAKEQYASNPDIDTSRSRYNFHLVQPQGKYRFLKGRLFANYPACPLSSAGMMRSYQPERGGAPAGMPGTGAAAWKSVPPNTLKNRQESTKSTSGSWSRNTAFPLLSKPYTPPGEV